MSDPKREKKTTSPLASGTGDGPAWELVEAGRYMPRRIRGSYRGRELGWAFVVPPGRADAKDEPKE